MCGLVGVFGEIDEEVKSIFRWMLYLDVLRGPHSTGITLVEKENDLGVMTYKETGLPHNVWVANPDVFSPNGIVIPDVKLMMGHNRFATRGEVVVDNAHPFTFGHITGAHNGTLTDFDLKVLEDHDKFDVDSKVIFRHIELKGPKNLWDRAHGAMALTWWDDKEQTFNIIRNNQRPLFMWRYNNAVIWSSEKWILTTARSHAGCQIRMDPDEVPVNKLHSFTFNNGKLGAVVEDFRPFVQNLSSTNTTKNVVGSSVVSAPPVYLKIHTFVPATNSKTCAGHFIANKVGDEAGKEYIIWLYAENLERSEGARDTIVAQNKIGVVWKINQKDCWQLNGYNNVNWRHLAVEYAKQGPKDNDKAKDKLGNDIDFFDFKYAIVDGCAACLSPIPPTEWTNLNKYVVLGNEGICFCPNCQDEELMEKTADYLKLDFIRNWS